MCTAQKVKNYVALHKKTSGPGWRHCDMLKSTRPRMANVDTKEIDRLTLIREILLRRCSGRRGTSKLPVLVDLGLVLPIVSVPLAAKGARRFSTSRDNDDP
jgi:hypothetical protein